MLHLPLDGGLLVALLVFLLLRGVGLIRDTADLHEFIEGLFDHLRPLRAAIFLQDRIALFVADVQRRAHGAEGRLHAVHLVDEILRRLTEIRGIRKAAHLLLQVFDLPALLRFRQVFDIPPAGKGQFDGMVRVDLHAFDVHAVLRTDDRKALPVQFRDHAGHTDGIEAVFGQIHDVFILFGDDDDHLFMRGYPFSARAPF